MRSHSHNIFCQLLLAASIVSAFVCDVSPLSKRCRHSSPSSSQLFGLAEWRDAASLEEINLHREVPLHLVPSEQVALPGETKYFQFQTQQELRLFQQSMDHTHGIFGLGLLVEANELVDYGGSRSSSSAVEDDREDDVSDAFLLDTFPLMEIVDYKNMNLGVDLGVFCTAQVVGRARLGSYGSIESEDEDGSSEVQTIAICSEVHDEPETHFSLEEVNTMAREVVEMIGRISDQEIEAAVAISREEDEEVERRAHRFQSALREAFQSDSQGYLLREKVRPGIRTWKELAAISWAAFSSSTDFSWEESYRLHAMDMDRVSTRMQLASFWLADKVVEVENASTK